VFTADELEYISSNQEQIEDVREYQEDKKYESGYISEMEKAIQFINDNSLETVKLRIRQQNIIRNMGNY
jgi:hypothetical protein